MRWLFSDPQKPAEASFRAEKLKQIDAWWQEFATQSGRLADLFARRSQWDLPGWMQQHLGAVDSRLMWEFGPAVEGDGHRLVITPEAERWLRPLVTTLLERAPRLRDWEFYAYRLPETIEQARSTVEAKSGVDLAETQVEARIGSGHRIELVYHSPQCSGPADNDALSAAFVATETLLGEELLDCWIGSIEVAHLPKGSWLSKLGSAAGAKGSRAIVLERLKPTIDALIGSLVDQLPLTPCHEYIADVPWTTLQLEPQEQPNHEDHVERTDLVVASTGCLAMWKGSHGGGIFHSGRYSRCNETFCYLKIDGAEGLGDSRFADRADIEDALNDALMPARAGCVIGGGTGLRYSYVDLALVDLSRGVQLIREMLQANGIPERTWLQFFDDDLAHEWIGMAESTPPPPM